MALEFPIIQRQRKPGAFPAADALRAAKAAALAASVTPESVPDGPSMAGNLPPVVETPVVTSAPETPKKKSA